MSRTPWLHEYGNGQGYAISGYPQPRAVSTGIDTAIASTSSGVRPRAEHHALELGAAPRLPDGDVAPPSYSETVLPPGWEAKRDDWGRLYYIDHTRGKTQWEAPVNVNPADFGGSPSVIQKLSSTFASASAPSYDAAGAPGVDSVAYGNYNSAYHADPRAECATNPSRAGHGSDRPVAPAPARGSQAELQSHSRDPPPSRCCVEGGHIPWTGPGGRRISLPKSGAAFDWSVLTQGQLDDVAPAELNVKDTIKDFNLCTALLDTIARNPCLAISSLVVWGMISFAVLLYLANPLRGKWPFDPPYLFLCIAGATYLLWTVFITANTGCLFGCIPMCRCVSSGKCLQDKPLEALRAPVAKDATGVKEYYAKLRSGRPVITLHVECSHTESSHSDSSSSSHSDSSSSSHTVVTYSAQRELAVKRWKDISVDVREIEEAVREHASGNICVSYSNSYRLHPSQVPLIEAMRVQFEEENAHRDLSTRAWVTYSVEGFDESHVDIIAKDATCHYCVYRLLCNWVTFYASVLLTLYIFYITMWKCVQKPVRLTSLKYIHLDEYEMSVREEVHNAVYPLIRFNSMPGTPRATAPTSSRAHVHDEAPSCASGGTGRVIT